MEVRVERIERDMADIKTDLRAIHEGMPPSFRTTWVLLIWNFAGLATLLALGFGWL
jgi:hypothetical protein